MSDAVTAASADASAKDVISKEPEVAQDEDCSKAFAPVVQLAKVETKTGEEDEDILFKVRAKLFRFSKELKEWKERGTGEVRVLQHRENKKIRLLMRREKTLKICMNQFVNPSVELKDNVGSDRSWVWQAIDYADEEKDEAMLAIRFRDSDNANQFKEAYNKAREHMKELANKDDTKVENKEELDDSNAKGSTEAVADESTKVDEKKD